jgi:ATP-dependent helicase/nuclease subunit A
MAIWPCYRIGIDMVIDQPIRDQVLDTSRSFIVQAPAGSGKTELLSNRFLNLLTIVESPEDILALTFTRKAAGEMRHRILSFVQLGLEKEPPEQDHLINTWLIAQKVVARDQEKQWNLLQNPNRLRVLTIDALCAGLAHQLPLLSRFGAMPEITDQIDDAYQTAVEYVLKDLDAEQPWSQDLYYVLQYLDNDWTRFHSLIANMLKKRSQWLPWVAQYSGHPEEKKVANQALKNVVESELARIAKMLPLSILTEVQPAIVQAAHICEQAGKKFPISAQEAQSMTLDTNVCNLGIWKALCFILLTQSNTIDFRKSVTKTIGFPTKKDGKDDIEKNAFEQNKQVLLSILETCHANPLWLQPLVQFQRLPNSEYDQQQWQLIHSLVNVLKVAAGYLKIVFSENRSCDFTEISDAAIQALGQADDPSEALLAIDYQVKHLLVDEYQDTNFSQNNLIQVMMSGWQPEEGRTLFLVGDPMQSIYRFRDAEVGLFLNVFHQMSLGDFPIESASLQVNFRSSEKIVEWNNQAFSQIFPQQSQVETGAVSYSPSIAFHPNEKNTNIRNVVFSGPKARDKEAEFIAELVDQQLESTEGSIAILVRSRSHLTEIVQSLKQKNIRYQAVDIDPLAGKMSVSDLQHFICAMLSPSDQVAWYACLRAPWLGLELSEMLAIHKLASSAKVSVREWCFHFHTNCEVAENGLISDGAKQRLIKLSLVMKQFDSQLGRKPLRMLIESGYRQLDGFSSVECASDLVDLDCVLDIISEQEKGGLLEDLSLFKSKIALLYAAPDTQSDGRVQLMTIHKSKGLQFETVIVPGLEHTTLGLDSQVLLWDTVLTESGDENFIIGPMGYEKSEHDPVYSYLAALEKQRLTHENQRLLYVALTRAEKSLVLTGKVDIDKEGGLKTPDPRTMLSSLWPIIKSSVEHVSSFSPSERVEKAPRLTRRLKHSNVISIATDDIVTNLVRRADFEFSHRQIGQCVHRELQLLVENPNYEARLGTQKYQDYLLARLTYILGGQDLEQLMFWADRIASSLKKVTQDKVGQWVLSRDYQHSFCEWPLIDIDHPFQTKHVIDRVFLDKDTLWIVDYKSSTPEKSQSLEAFLIQEWSTYLSQLTRYKKLASKLGFKDIRCGLYFPLIQAWYSAV